MKSLYITILEAFNRQTNIDGAVQFLKGTRKFNDKQLEYIKNFLVEILGDVDKGDLLLSDDARTKYIKIPRVYFNNLKQSNLTNGIDLNVDSLTIDNHRFAAFGDGSFGKLLTKEQEQAPCLTWNWIMDNITSGDKKLQLTEDLFVEAFNAVLPDAEGKYKDWYNSFKNSVRQIYRFCKQYQYEPSNYRMVRYGGGEIGIAISRAVKSYMKSLGLPNRHDIIYPADIILYQKNFNGPVDPSWESFNDAIRNKVFVGISLKKSSKEVRSYEVFNHNREIDIVGKINSVGEVKPIKSGVAVELRGEFAVNGTNGVVQLNLRTFGKPQLYMDITTPGAEAVFGKVPVNVWRDILGVKNNKDNGSVIKLFEKYVAETKRINATERFAPLINAGFKSGGDCLPFVLVY